MYAQSDTIAPQSSSSAAKRTATRAALRTRLRTRPRIQRSLIRSWEYIPFVRITVLAIRLLVTLWLVVLGAVLMSAGQTWGWILLLPAAAVAAFGLWVFTTAGREWPVVEG